MKDDKNRAAELEALIEKYQKSYYAGESEISDGEFDALWDELKALAPESPALRRIGDGAAIDGFPKARHLIPMGSQEKAASAEEFIAWAKKRGLEKFIAQHKLDGASLELQYEKGRLSKAVTRGNGIVGDEITGNALRMSGVVARMDASFTGGVRGEVVMPRSLWREKHSSKANCRNAGTGIMRRKDGAGCEDLSFVAYDATETSGAPEQERDLRDEARKLEWLRARGFAVVEARLCVGADQVVAFREETAAARDALPFDIDGLVVKDLATDPVDLRRARPEKQIAFKFAQAGEISVLREVQWSESGATYTPIGIVDPVRIAGTTVRRANLCNPDMIRALGLKIGSTVLVVKRGEIIPKIEGLAPGSEGGGGDEIAFPTACATCGAELVDAGTRLYCPNPLCPKRALHRLEKWTSVLDIRELGEKLLRQLFDAGKARSIPELYALEPQELAQFERMGDISAQKVIRNLRAPRELSLAAFVAGFDIEGVAEATIEKLALAGFDTLEKLRAASPEDLADVHGIGEANSGAIALGLVETAAEMDATLAAGVIGIAPPLAADAASALPLRGLSFCFTGELSSMKRAEAEEKARALGGAIKSSVVKGLSFLVAADPRSNSGKNKKARDLGVEVIGEARFLEMLDGAKPAAAAAPEQGELF